MREYIIAMRVKLEDYQAPEKWLMGTMGSVMMQNISYTVEEIKNEESKKATTNTGNRRQRAGVERATGNSEAST
tara:strand:+ start:933 stop:1154 length:222 start_codon:yes stop_codon:yes gene_type:complete